MRPPATQLSRSEERKLRARAFELAQILMGSHSHEAAQLVAEAIVSQLPRELKSERRRWLRDKSAKRRKSMLLGAPQLAQLHLFELILRIESEPAPVREASDGLSSSCVRYLVKLMTLILHRTSMQAAVAVDSFIYQLEAGKIADVQALLTNNGYVWEERHILEARKTLLVKLQEAFPGMFRSISRGGAASSSATDRGGGQDEIEKLLVALAPWDGRCDLPEKPSPINPNLGYHHRDLNSEAEILSPGEDPQLEINRVYALIEPSVHRRLGKLLGWKPSEIEMPEFST